jgi:hypothetical protein
MATLGRWGLIGAAMVLVLWIRTLPLALPVTDDWADDLMARRLYQRMTQEVAPDVPLSQWQARVVHRAQQWAAQHEAQFASARTELAQRLKAQLRYMDNDGRDYVYLGDFDSYLWLRHARNYLRQGTTCDAIVQGECRDTYTNAPVGAWMMYQRSLHITAIVGLHKLITFFQPAYPLPASAFLVPVIMGVLGVLPAFGIGRRLAGPIAGLCAALLTALSPTLLLRSIGSDNDVWNVALPLSMMWAAIAAMTTPSPRRQLAYSILAGICAGLHAYTWRGWLFAYAVLSAGLLGQMLLQSLRHIIQTHTLRVWQAVTWRKMVLVTVIFYGVAGLCTTLARPEESYLELPRTILGAVWGTAARTDGASVQDAWPDVLQTVTELVRPRMQEIVQDMGGRLFFFGGMLGLLFLALPQERWRWAHFVVLALSLPLYGYLVTTHATLSRGTMLMSLALPLVLGLLLTLIPTEEPESSARDVACLLALWLLGALYLAYDGIRFLLLLETPCGLACAVTIGRLSIWVRRLAVGAAAWYRIVTAPLLALVLGLVLAHPVQWGYTAARSYAPHMNDAWWDTLTHIRDTTPPEAIVNTWWDYGHWVKYVAERRVSSDGGTLTTHVPHWLGKALITPDPQESLGILRMLNCASDATPRPEGQRGAYGQLRAAGYDMVTAYAIIQELVNSTRPTAQHSLARHGLSATLQASVLQATHCVPPTAYLLLSSALLSTARSWMHLGLWDPRQGDRARRLHIPPTANIGDLTERFQSTEPTAARLYAPVQTSAGGGYLSPWWLPCQAHAEQAALVCTIKARLRPTDLILEDFVYHPDAAAEARLRVRRVTPQGTTDTLITGAPAVLILAGARQLEEVVLTSPIHPDFGVLVDLPQHRILIGTPLLLRSTFTQLMYLDGRYTTAFEKWDERSVETGERVVTWGIHWDGRE